jgi:hypothetical protein
MDGTLQSTLNRQGCGVVSTLVNSDIGHGSSDTMDAVNWTENLSTYDIKNQQFIKHIKFDKYKFIVKYHRLDEDDFVVDEVQTLDEQNITDLLSCRTLDRIERKLK